MVVFFSAMGALAGCNGLAPSDSGGVSTKSISPYCNYLPSKTFSDPVTVSGRAAFEYRLNGNGAVTDGLATVSITAVNNFTYSVTVNSRTYNFTADASATATEISAGLAASINADSSAVVTTSGTTSLVLSAKAPGDTLTISVGSNLSLAQNTVPGKIKYAEVRVTDSSGVIVQCAETDANGDFSFQLPKNSGSYTVAVASRASNSNYKAYVLNNPTDNVFYTVSKSVSSGSNTSGVQLVAKATGTLEGGAFNILDQIYKANKFLRDQTVNCSGTFSACTPFSVAPEIHAYWAKGVNPGTYFGLTNPISFYLPGQSELYLMGGLNGDVDASDTDHFDNSVIIHEYGHFIEDIYAQTDSPGGSHNGNSIIDPRLAWGEGWANFFQAAVTGNPVYRDTSGNIDGTPGVYFNVDIENVETIGSKHDVPADMSAVGEGNFHEFSITRLLWDTIDPHPVTGAGGADGSSIYPGYAGGNETVQSPFSELWTLFTGLRDSGSTTAHFRNIGLVHYNQTHLSGHQDWSVVLLQQKHLANQTDFATPISLIGSGATCPSNGQTFTATMTPVTTTNGSFAASNLYKNNDFFAYNHTGGALNIGLTNNSSGSTADLDLYLYKEHYTYGSDSSIVARSDATVAGGNESISTSAPAGWYMINVMAYTGNGAGTTANYTLTINGQKVCPNP